MGEDEGIENGAGDDLVIYEAHLPDSLESDEKLDEDFSIYAEDDSLGPWELVGNGRGTCSFDLGEMSAARYIKIVDDGDGDSLARAPGYDLDAVEALHIVGVTERTESPLSPKAPILFQNYPNPFNTSTEITYHLPEECYVKLEIFNILGQRVAKLVDQKQTAGLETVTWEAKSVASGIYFSRLTITKQHLPQTKTKKMVLLR
jgi:hypothetical protein